MKIGIRVASLLMSAAVLVSVCSCESKKDRRGKDKGSKDRIEETKGDKEDIKEKRESFSGNTMGSLFQLMDDATGKDKLTAVQMIEDYFGTELADSVEFQEEWYGLKLNTEFYYTRLYTGEYRFLEVSVGVDPDTDVVRRISFYCSNDDFFTSSFDDLKGFDDEVRSLVEAADSELEDVCGEPFETGDLVADEDSFYHLYKYGNDCEIRVEYYDYTEEGGNGLLAVELFFTDNSVPGEATLE